MKLVKFREKLNFELNDLERFLKDLLNDKQEKTKFSPLNSIYLEPNDEEDKNSQSFYLELKKILNSINFQQVPLI